MTLAARLAAAQRDPELVAAAAAMASDRLDVAERGLKGVLRARPTEVAAIRMLAEVAARLGRYRDAEALLARALELAPDFHTARANYVTVLHRQSKFADALAHAERLIAAEPADLGHLALKAAVLVRTGEYDAALDAYDRILAAFPDNAPIWVSRGHVLKTVGRQNESVAAYRRAIAIQPSFGDAWWSLANLKVSGFDDHDMTRMHAALAAAANSADRYHLHFALGKALEDRGDYAASFENYAAGNRMRRAELPYRAERTSAHVAASRDRFTAEAFARAGAGGHPADDPIFIVGLPRAGSTLLEQILASHSQVEGTMELPDIGTIAADLGGRDADGTLDDADAGYIPHLLGLTPAQRRELGARYLAGTGIQRKTGRPRFIDKMPNNFAHIGLIHQILPNATIIDARRHPMANGFSAFKQHFSRGQGFTYDLRDIGLYWRDYAAVMAHYEAVLPGRVLLVRHERLIADPEREIRRLLDHCRLPFEPGCLTPHRNSRPVRTASSEQVRRPIAKAPDEAWRHYAQWLGPLREALAGADVEYERALTQIA
ncbi:sulfotransferase [Novosphingobium sp. Gsoil 351]|uniref:tetratricopeptide repeat-containing sulfotransferase family protein n=1 Tax=Novosphingobium sp. Gsoil 351 TaxID=2675225 RepID=UPI0018A82063|nr:sulfotransferase [Novosphingobium sp. Gsoil 351]